MDLVQEIARLKSEKNAVILAHYYQDPEIQDISDFIGDSLQLAQEAAKTTADVICFCGVHFMAETAKILNPTKTVILPDLLAGCSLASGCPANAFAAWIDREKTRHPGREIVVVSYINCTAEVKALSDLICTSSNAEKIINSIPTDKVILFGPDRNLGRYLIQKTGREMICWNGVCVVHETFSERRILALREQHPKALLLAHPECEDPILRMADFIGSTTALLRYSISSNNDEFIIATESGILHQMTKASPEKKFYPAPPNNESCNCNDCPFMKMNTLEKVHSALLNLSPQIELPQDLMTLAKVSIDRMMELSV